MNDLTCAVCGLADARALTTTVLADGTTVPVCGSHALAHDRALRRAESRDELATVTCERRARRRRASGGDALAVALTDAFSPSRRGAADRRRRG